MKKSTGILKMPQTLKRLGLCLTETDTMMLDFLASKLKINKDSKSNFPLLIRYAIFHLFCHEKYDDDPNLCETIESLIKQVK